MRDDAELIEAMRVYDACRMAAAKAEEELHVIMAARQFRREVRMATGRLGSDLWSLPDAVTSP